MLTGKWNDSYTRELAILEHIQELQVLHAEEARLKAMGERDLAHTVRNQFKRELADLYLILEKEYEDADFMLFLRRKDAEVQAITDLEAFNNWE